MGGHEKYKELATYLSRNDTRLVYKETDEEQVILKLREVLHAQQEDARAVMADPTVNAETQVKLVLSRFTTNMTVSNNSKYAPVITFKEGRNCATNMLAMGSHFRNSSLVSTTKLTETFRSEEGGVSY